MPVTGLLILDGWGHSTREAGNAVRLARTPVWDVLCRDYPNVLITAHGEVVGLPVGQMGHSEVGHLTLGAGRTVFQSYTRINAAIRDGSLDVNPVLRELFSATRAHKAALHVIGLWSPGGVHSHEDHIRRVIELAVAEQLPSIFVHLISDGRDVAPRSALSSCERLRALAGRDGVAIASLTGRFYAMDRDHRWERTERAYRLYTEGRSDRRAQTLVEAVERAYARGESDEFISPTVVGCGGHIRSGDRVVLANFRGDRFRQLAQALGGESFTAFARPWVVSPDCMATLTCYHSDYPFPCLFPPQPVDNSLGECFASAGLRQLRIAETEKYPHVTFFFNGGRDEPFAHERRILVPSPRVSTYDRAPRMSLDAVVQKLTQAVEAQSTDVFVANFANPDMVGHSGNFEAAVAAVEACDEGLGRVLSAVQNDGGEVIVCADHGNAETMIDPHDGGMHTAHTTNPVPLAYFGGKKLRLRSGGDLTDVAPTLLALLGMGVPHEMTGKSLITV